MATTARLISILAAGLEDNQGNPLSGYQVRTYASDGVTPQVVWTSRDKTLPTPGGLSSFNLDTTGSYQAYGDGVYTIKIWTPTANPATDSPYRTFSDADTSLSDTGIYLTDGSRDITGDVNIYKDNGIILFESSPNKIKRFRIKANITDAAEDGIIVESWNGSTYDQISKLGSSSDFSISGAYTKTRADTGLNILTAFPTDYGVGKPALLILKDTTTSYLISLFDSITNTGTLKIKSTNFTFNDNQVWHAGSFGVFQAKSVSTVYQAPSDGLVFGYIDVGGGGAVSMTGYTDASNPPTTIVVRNYANTSEYASLTFPVRSGQYWQVQGSVTALYFMPIG